MNLVEAATAPAGRPVSRVGVVNRECRECGTPFEARRDQTPRQEFCCPAHKRQFNNRRMVRGAVVFDLFMALRCERSLARKLGVWTELCRIAQAYRDEDMARRKGRKSWRNPTDVIAERPWLRAVVLHRNINPKKPGGFIS